MNGTIATEVIQPCSNSVKIAKNFSVPSVAEIQKLSQRACRNSYRTKSTINLLNVKIEKI